MKIKHLNPISDQTEDLPKVVCLDGKVLLSLEDLELLLHNAAKSGAMEALEVYRKCKGDFEYETEEAAAYVGLSVDRFMREVKRWSISFTPGRPYKFAKSELDKLRQLRAKGKVEIVAA